MELKQYFSILRKWLWLILLATAIAAGVSYITTSRQPKQYQATAKLLVGQSIESPNPSSGDLFTSQQLALTYIQIAKTTPVLQRTLDALGIQLSAEELRRDSWASIIQGTQLIQVSVINTDPARAQALANELAHQLTLEGPAAAAQEQAKRHAFAQQQLEDLQNKIQSAQDKIIELGKSIQTESSAVEIAEKQQEITTLQTQVTQWQQTSASLLTFLAPQSPNYLSILEPASLPIYPIAPNVMQSVLVAAAIGLFLALGGVFLIEFLDDRFKSPEEVTDFLHLPILGSISRIPSSDQKLIARLPPRSPVVEAYRILRTNIQFSGVDRSLKSILITSPGQGEGKSITAANLAVVLAQAGLRTILVDGDLYKPVQHRIFGMTNDIGLTDAMIGKANLTNVMRPTKVENLSLVTTGTLPPNPTELLGSERMRILKSELEAESDVVVFDTPPCLPLADAPILGRSVDCLLLVLDMPRVRRKAALRAKEALEKIGGHVSGAVLNRISPRELGYSYDYYRPPKPEKSKGNVLAGAKPQLLAQWFKGHTRQ